MGEAASGCTLYGNENKKEEDICSTQVALNSKKRLEGWETYRNNTK
jgi:hypothetical protein